jgi:hypothetical protein
MIEPHLIATAAIILAGLAGVLYFTWRIDKEFADAPPIALAPPGDQRCDYLGAVRQNEALLEELVRDVRSHWPLRYPMPEHLDALLRYHEIARDNLRDGRLKKLAEICRESD